MWSGRARHKHTWRMAKCFYICMPISVMFPSETTISSVESKGFRVTVPVVVKSHFVSKGFNKAMRISRVTFSVAIFGILCATATAQESKSMHESDPLLNQALRRQVMRTKLFYSERSISPTCTTGTLLARTSPRLSNYSRHLATKGTRYMPTLGLSEPEQIRRQ